MSNGLPAVRIEMDYADPQRGKVYVDGVQMPGVRAVTVHLHADGDSALVDLSIMPGTLQVVLAATQLVVEEDESVYPAALRNMEQVCDQLDVDGSLEVTEDGATMSLAAFNNLAMRATGTPRTARLRRMGGDDV